MSTRDKAEELSLITNLLLATVRQEMFKDSDEVTLSKKYFDEKIRLQSAMKAAKLIVKALHMYEQGMPVEMIMFVIKLEQIAGVIEVKKMDTSEHDCKNCHAAEQCPIKDIMQQLNDVSDDDSISKEDLEKKINNLIKDPLKHTGKSCKN